MNEKIVEGKTVEEAIELGLKELGLSREEIDYEVLDTGKSGLFGMMGKQAKVKIRPRGDAVERAVGVVKKILDHMDVQAEVTGSQEEDQIGIDIHGAGGILIGRRGQTLSSLQYLVNRMLNQDQEEWDRILIDVEGYRQRREKEMGELADRLYKKVVNSGQEISVKNLSAHDRRIIHMNLKSRREVRTHSHGTGHFRRLVVSPTESRPRQEEPSTSKRVREFTKRFDTSTENNDDS